MGFALKNVTSAILYSLRPALRNAMSLSPAPHLKMDREVLHSPSPPCDHGWETKTRYLLFVARPREPRNFTFAAADPRKPASHPPGSAGPGLLSGIRARRRTRSRPAAAGPAAPAQRSRPSVRPSPARVAPAEPGRTPGRPAARRPAPLPPRPARGSVRAPPPLGPPRPRARRALPRRPRRLQGPARGGRGGSPTRAGGTGQQ